MKPYRDRTMNRAVGAVNNEWVHMARLAVSIRKNRFSPTKEEEIRKKFTGIYKRLLDDPLDEVIREAKY